MTRMVRLGTGARVWRADGVGATVRDIGRLGVFARLDGERALVVLNLLLWRLALTCDYCDRAAEVQLIDGQPGDVLCKACAHDQFDRPADWVRPIPRKVVRGLYDQCQTLCGVTEGDC